MPCHAARLTTIWLSGYLAFSSGVKLKDAKFRKWNSKFSE